MDAREGQRTRARTLVVCEGKSLAEVAALVGVPEGTLKRWSAAEGWQSKREESGEYPDLLRQIKLGAARRAKESPTPENVEALCKMERVYPERHYAPDIGLREMAVRVFEPFSVWLSSQRQSPEVLQAISINLEKWLETL